VASPQQKPPPGSGGSGSGGKHHKDRPSGGKDGARGGGPSKDDKCRYCGKKGHWAHECRKRLRDEAEANLTQAEEDEDPGLLMAQVCELGVTHDTADTRVELNEERAEAHLGKTDGECDTCWYLDTGATNHMTGWTA
jgi:hypothetical protein